MFKLVVCGVLLLLYIPEANMERKTAYTIHPLLTKRWSPRALSGEQVSDDELKTLFEAARWAPSSYNNQPWRFVYAHRDTPYWEDLLNLLVPFNKQWAQHAGTLVVIISKDTFDFNGKPSRTSSLDTGSAWQNLALQATHMGLIAHGMEGFKYKKAKEVLNIPDGYTIQAMCAVGKPGKKEGLPEELQEQEKPSDRKPIASFIFEGKFGKDR